MMSIKKTLKQQRYLKTKREYKEIKDGYLYRHVKVPGALIEMGFLSNPSERNKLKNESYQNRISNSISKGVEAYLKNAKKR